MPSFKQLNIKNAIHVAQLNFNLVPELTDGLIERQTLFQNSVISVTLIAIENASFAGSIYFKYIASTPLSGFDKVWLENFTNAWPGENHLVLYIEVF